MRVSLRVGLLLAGLLAGLGTARPAEAGRKQVEAAIERQLALTRSAAELHKGMAALERERESLAYAERLLRHRAEESLRRLSSYRSARDAREGQTRKRARALYKLARGGLARLYFEDLAPGARDEKSADRITRGRTVRWLVRHDLRELDVHRRAEERARAELLAATREMAALSALRMTQGVQGVALEGFESSLTPSLLASVRTTKKLGAKAKGGRSRQLLKRAQRELRDLRRQRGFDLLEPRSLPRPVPGRIIGKFGRHYDKELRLELERKGIELRARAGHEVQAIAAGRVAFVGALPGYDRVVVVDHGGGYLSLTGRLLDIEVEAGDEVEAGAALGRVAPAPPDARLGTSVYLELRHGERPIDPSAYLARK